MADGGNPEAEAKGRSPMGMILLASVVALGIGMAGGFLLYERTAEPEPVAVAEGSEEEVADGDDAAADFQERLLSLDPMVVNITGDGYARLLKIRVELECESKEVRDEAEARLAQIQDSLLTLISSKRLADVTSFEGKALLKDDLLDRMNVIMTSGRVSSVLITEFVVQ